MMDFLPPRSTITRDYYAGILCRLRDSFRQKRWGKVARGVLPYDNAPVYKASRVQATLGDCSFEQLNHPPFSKDLGPSDYLLFHQVVLVPGEEVPQP